MNLYNLLKDVAFDYNLKLEDPSEVFNIVLQIDSKAFPGNIIQL